MQVLSRHTRGVSDLHLLSLQSQDLRLESSEFTKCKQREGYVNAQLNGTAEDKMHETPIRSRLFLVFVSLSVTKPTKNLYRLYSVCHFDLL